MRFGLAGISHETNTFHSIPTEYENFEKSGVLLRGKEIEKLYETPSTIGGFYKASKDFGFDIVPLLFANTPLLFPRLFALFANAFLLVPKLVPLFANAFLLLPPAFKALFPAFLVFIL